MNKVKNENQHMDYNYITRTFITRCFANFFFLVMELSGTFRGWVCVERGWHLSKYLSKSVSKSTPLPTILSTCRPNHKSVSLLWISKFLCRTSPVLCNWQVLAVLLLPILKLGIIIKTYKIERKWKSLHYSITHSSLQEWHLTKLWLREWLRV